MEFSIEREALLKPLQWVAGVVERRQTQPILANVLLRVESNALRITGTDLEVELVARVPLSNLVSEGMTTIPAKKFIDICKSLPNQAEINISESDHKVVIRSGRSRFSLSALSPEDFPNLEELPGKHEFTMAPPDLRQLIDNSHFSMAQNDVRYYLNGLYLDILPGVARAVATDGHRLAMSSLEHAGFKDSASVIIPRKGVVELLRLLSDIEEELMITLTENHIRIMSKEVVFTSKLIDGRFPDYTRVIPQNCDKNMVVDRDLLKETLHRVAILSNEKYRGVRLIIRENSLTLLANNPEQEEAEEVIEMDYQGESFEVGFNVSYLIDVLAHMPSGKVGLAMSDAKSSLLMQSLQDEHSSYVIMPMRV